MFSRQGKGRAFGSASVACQVHLAAVPQSCLRSQARKGKIDAFPSPRRRRRVYEIEFAEKLELTGEGGRSVFWGRGALPCPSVCCAELFPCNGCCFARRCAGSSSGETVRVERLIAALRIRQTAQ